MSRATRLSTLALLPMILCATSALALDLGGHDRDGGVLGVQLGAGWNKLEFAVMDDSGETIQGSTGWESAFSGGVSIGWAPNDNFIYSVGIAGWKRSFYQQISPISVTTFHFMLDLAWFPRGEGFWIKAGAGSGTLDFSMVLPEARVTFKKAGWNFVGGVGYELRASDDFALGLAYDFRFLTVGQFEGLEDTKVYSHNASLSLRFYM